MNQKTGRIAVFARPARQTKHHRNKVMGTPGCLISSIVDIGCSVDVLPVCFDASVCVDLAGCMVS